MSDIKDNPPPLPVSHCDFGLLTPEQYRAGEAAAFSRGVAAGQAAMQGEIERLTKGYERSLENGLALVRELDELRAKLRALEEQKPVGYASPGELRRITECRGQFASIHLQVVADNDTPLYLAAGAKHESE